MSERGFLTLENSEDLRLKLGESITSINYNDYKDKFGIHLSSKDFDWLTSITKENLDEQLSKYLIEHPPTGTRFVSLDVIEHLKEVTELINKCNDRKSSIFDLEARAILSGLEYFQFLETFNSEILLGEINLKAIYKQSGLIEDEEKYNAAFRDKTLAAFEVLRTKLNLHNEKGNSLNYGERVSYLRDLYCDDVKTIYERLIAIKRVLRHSFGQETERLPNFKDVGSKLDLIVWWVRNAAKEFETVAEHEYFFEKTISINNLSFSSNRPEPETPFGDHHLGTDNKPLPDFKSQQLSHLITYGGIEFKVTEDDFNLVTSPIGENRHLRIIGISVNVIENSKAEPHTSNSRDTRLYYCELTPPTQNLQLELNKIYDLSLSEKEEIKDMLEDAIQNGTAFPITTIGRISGIDNNGRIIFEQDEREFEELSFPNIFIAGDIKPVHGTSILDEQKFHSPKSIRNINPFGTWYVYLKNTTLGNMQRFYGLSQVVDFSITFRIGVRNK